MPKQCRAEGILGYHDDDDPFIYFVLSVTQTGQWDPTRIIHPFSCVPLLILYLHQGDHFYPGEWNATPDYIMIRKVLRDSIKG